MNTVLRLKADFHTHTAEDPRDNISYGAFELIDRAAELGFEVLSITNHDAVTYDRELADYAEKRGILLVPGIEVTLSNKHIVIINPDVGKVRGKARLEDLPSLKSSTNLVIAPHAFYLGFKSLLSSFYPYLPFFDAIEHASYYSRLLNMNKRAAEASVRSGKPMVATSDCHNIWQFGTSFTFVSAAKDPASVIEAVKAGRVEIASSPLSNLTMARIAFNFLLCDRLKLPFRI